MNAIRPDLPTLPERMRHLHVSDRGYPVPWFVAWLDAEGKPARRGQGKPDFRVIAPAAIVDAHTKKLCWLCGDTLGSFRSFVIGPMSAINRTSAEPPSHLECADYAARACPFLTNPRERRNEKNLPSGHEPLAGESIRRNPGVALVWTTKRYGLFSDRRGGALFDVGHPEHVRWYAEGRPATRAEVIESIESGLPLLRAEAEKDGREALEHLGRLIARAATLVPAEVG